ncbi:MAG: type II secretion system F family protein [Hyphomonadaceae bacterium JAD_PAG50586_4]|nr:MAG: type II secretion system F family protein [Hyphomonadaceae bacterium JAD_PAG50586_4]
MSARRFVVRAISETGTIAIQNIEAPTRADAMRRAMQSGMAVIELREEAPITPGRRPITRDHAILVLKQLSVMVGAGVRLLDALETLASSVAGTVAAERLNAVILALRRGDRFGDALEHALPIYPAYVYGLVRAGESSGKLARVLAEAAQQLSFEQRVERDILNALTYPLFLVVSGAGSVAFLLYAVVPRFATMLESSRASPGGISRLVIDAGVAFHANAPAIVLSLVGIVFALLLWSRTRAAGAVLRQIAHATPGLRTLLAARQSTTWTRVAALSLDAGVGLLDAVALAAGALPEGAHHRAVLAAAPGLRAGTDIDAAFRASGAISEIDASLLRAGQRSGALGEMFHAIANRQEEALRDALKRLTLIVEPVAIATVALLVGGIVLALASALAGVYEAIG